MKVCSRDWWENVVMVEFTDADRRENFCMSRGSFMKLSEMMERVMKPAKATVRPPVPLKMRVLKTSLLPHFLLSIN